MFLARAKVPDNPKENAFNRDDHVFIESSIESIVRALEAGTTVKYFFIRLQANSTTLQPITLKSGARAAGQNTEIAEIEAGGVTVGSTRIDKP